MKNLGSELKAIQLMNFTGNLDKGRIQQNFSLIKKRKKLL